LYLGNAEDVAEILGKRDRRFNVMDLYPFYLSGAKRNEMDLMPSVGNMPHPLLYKHTPRICQVTDFHL
jgi:hypothetical protein